MYQAGNVTVKSNIGVYTQNIEKLMVGLINRRRMVKENCYQRCDEEQVEFYTIKSSADDKPALGQMYHEDAGEQDENGKEQDPEAPFRGQDANSSPNMGEFYNPGA